MIDFKKAGNFMKDSTPTEGNHVGDNFASPRFINKEIVSPVPKPTEASTPGQIFNPSISPMEVPVKKTGFFGKMKNFFSKRELETTIAQADQMTNQQPIQNFSGMPAQMRPEIPPVQPTTTTPDAAVDDVKIFDEVVVKKVS